LRRIDISITEFKRRCYEIVRHVEESGEAVSITRRGRIVARIAPSLRSPSSVKEPWKRLCALGGKLMVGPEESSLRDEDFKANR